MSNQSVYANQNFTYNKIPEFAREYKREYQFIRGINKELKYVIDKIYYHSDYDGIFDINTCNRIKNFIKRFLIAQEEGKLNDISDLVFSKENISSVIFIDNTICFIINLEYDYIEKHYPYVKEFYDIFKKFFNKLKFDSV